MYKKRIKDWGIDKNLKSDKLSTSPRIHQRRDATPNDSQSSVRGTVAGAQKKSNYVGYCPDLAHQPQYGTSSSAEEARQRECQNPTTTLAPQQHSAGHYWASAAQSHGYGSPYSPPLAQSDQLDEKARSSILLDSIRDRFLEASDAVTRRDTAGLFEILNPAYEAISKVSETEPTQLLAVVVDLFELLYRRPNHQDMLRQLLHYVFALVPDAVRQDQFLSYNSQVLTLLGQSGHDSAFDMPLDTADSADSRPAASRHDYNYYQQPSEAGPAFDNGTRGDYRHPC